MRYWFAFQHWVYSERSSRQLLKPLNAFPNQCSYVITTDRLTFQPQASIFSLKKQSAGFHAAWLRWRISVSGLVSGLQSIFLSVLRGKSLISTQKAFFPENLKRLFDILKPQDGSSAYESTMWMALSWLLLEERQWLLTILRMRRSAISDLLGHLTGPSSVLSRPSILLIYAYMTLDLPAMPTGAKCWPCIQVPENQDIGQFQSSGPQIFYKNRVLPITNNSYDGGTQHSGIQANVPARRKPVS